MTSKIPDLNFGDMFDALAPLIADRPAIVYGDVIRSWRDLDVRSNRLARRLIALNLKPDSKVAFYLRNSPAYVELFAACVKARLVHVNVNYRYVDHELHYLLENSDAEAVVYDAEFRPHIEKLKADLPGIRAFIEYGDQAVPDFAESYERACTGGNGSPLSIQRSGDDLYFMYTGGTTGYPKAVMWPHKERIAVIGMSVAEDAEDHANAVATAEQWPIVMSAAPMMHSTGLTAIMSTLCQGGTIVLLPSRGFDAKTCLEEIDKSHVMRLSIVGDAFSVPLLMYLREHADDFDLSSVELVTSAGAMWSEQFKQELLEYFPNALLSDSLGSSEGSRIGYLTTRRGEPSKTGKFQLGPDVKVFSEDFREVEPGSGEPGMLAKAGPLPLGYYKDEERTAKTFPTVNGVRYSMAGDWCRIEADGTMTLLGRGNNCINTGGEKVFPEEVEDALKKLPRVLDAAVLGIPDERWGNAVGALLKTVDDQPIDAEEIKEHLDEYIARYKHPKIIRYVDVAFRHENGKINYRAARRLIEKN
jgi:fatty-acyl-CoA synthase